MDKKYVQSINELFPFLLKDKNNESLMNIAKIPAGRIVFQEGEECEFIAFILKGVIRVSKIGKNGKELYLYRVGSGESCILMISSILATIGYPATATVEEDVEVLILPVTLFKQWMQDNLELQKFVYKLLSERLVSVMTLIEEIVFHKMDARVAEFLLEKGEGIKLLSITHDRIAMELGTAREVVSRIMKDFQRKGWIEMSRGKVKILDRESLRNLCNVT
jgi:CRP/FNR family transcriptional regulator